MSPKDIFVTPIDNVQLKELFTGIKEAVLLTDRNHLDRVEIFETLCKFSDNKKRWTKHEWFREWNMGPGIAYREFAILAFALGALFELKESKPLSGNKSCPELGQIWDLVFSVLTSEVQDWFSVKTGIPGMEVVTLFIQTLDRDGKPALGKCVRLHLWLPNGNRGPKNFQTHVHQLFGQSWVLMGQGVDTQYAYHDVHRPRPGVSVEEEMIPMARYILRWRKVGNPTEFVNCPNNTVGVRMRTDDIYALDFLRQMVNRINETYTISNSVAHKAKPGMIHATLFLFDASVEGINEDAPILGPLDQPTDDNDNEVMMEQASRRCKAGGVVGHYAHIVDNQRRMELAAMNALSDSSKKDIVDYYSNIISDELKKAGFEEYVYNPYVTGCVRADSVRN